MARAAILLAVLALVAVGANLVVGAGVRLGLATVDLHFRLAVPSTIAALFAWTVVVFYFIGATAWVREAVEERGASAAVLAEARKVHRLAMPWVLVALALLIVAYVLGGGAHSGAVSWTVHLGFAVSALLAHVVAAYRTIVLVGMMLDLQARAERDGPA